MMRGRDKSREYEPGGTTAKDTDYVNSLHASTACSTAHARLLHPVCARGQIKSIGQETR